VTRSIVIVIVIVCEVEDRNVCGVEPRAGVRLREIFDKLISARWEVWMAGHHGVVIRCGSTDNTVAAVGVRGE
jgi:hypothetical protein